MNTLYQEYAVIDSEIKALELKKEQLRTGILAEMIAKGEDKVATDVGSFAIAKLKKWVYPEKVIAIGEKFKAAKAKAESTGEATYEESNSLRFSGVKL